MSRASTRHSKKEEIPPMATVSLEFEPVVYKEIPLNDGWDTFLPKISQCTSPIRFCLWNSSITFSKLEKIFEIVERKQPGAFKEVSIDRCDGIPASIDVRKFSWASSVSIVSLRSNQLQDQHAKTISESLSQITSSPGIQHLTLWDNEIGDQGATAIASALKTNRTLLSLSLGKNKIGKEGFQALSLALSRAVLTPQEANNRRKVVKDVEKKKKEAVTKFRKTKPIPDEKAVDAFSKPFDQQMEDLTPIEENGVCYGKGNRILLSLNVSHNLCPIEDAQSLFAEVTKHNQEIKRIVLSVEQLLPVNPVSETIAEDLSTEHIPEHNAPNETAAPQPQEEHTQEAIEPITDAPSTIQ